MLEEGIARQHACRVVKLCMCDVVNRVNGDREIFQQEPKTSAKSPESCERSFHRAYTGLIHAAREDLRHVKLENKESNDRTRTISHLHHTLLAATTTNKHHDKCGIAIETQPTPSPCPP